MSKDEASEPMLRVEPLSAYAEHWRDKFDFSEQEGVDCGSCRSIWFGDYDWKFLCMPQWPWCRGKNGGSRPPPFFGTDEMLSVCVATIMGLQHALAMTGGLITPPLLVASAANNEVITEYLVSAALIVSGICTITHVVQFPIPFTNLKYGTGILSVTGISFTFLTTTQDSIAVMMAAPHNYTFDQAYGKLLGTIMVCCWTTVLISFIPPRVLRRIFPPFVTGVTIFLIGAALIGTGFESWGGGAFCAEYVNGLPPDPIYGCMVPDATNTTLVNGTCYAPAIIPTCSGNGNVFLPFGSPEYVGLGFLVFATLWVIEIFGSPFLRNAEVVIGLLFAYAIAAAAKHDGQSYISTTPITEAPGGTFLWVHTFPIGFYAPAVLPYIISFMVVAIEGIGDITATEEASGLETQGNAHRRHIQGGLLGDGINCFFGALGTTLPTTTFAQNNGVIVLTRCGSRSAGFACGCWLIIFGIVAKIGAFIVTIPNCVLGGMTTFLFANVCVSGIKVICLGDLTRRTRFILAIALAVGLGVTLVPTWATNALWPVTPTMSSGLLGFRDAVILLLSSGFSIGALLCIALHIVIPLEQNPELAKDAIFKPSGLYDRTASHHPNRSNKGSNKDASNTSSSTSFEEPMKPVEMADMIRKPSKPLEEV